MIAIDKTNGDDTIWGVSPEGGRRLYKSHRLPALTRAKI